MKKDSLLQVKLPKQQLEDYKKACQSDGMGMSEATRQLIRTYTRKTLKINGQDK